MHPTQAHTGNTDGDRGPDTVATGTLVPGAPDVSGSDGVSWDPSVWRDTAEGYCFTCDCPVQVEFYRYWAGSEPPTTCPRCGGHDVIFLDRLSRLLLQRIEELEQQLEERS